VNWSEKKLKQGYTVKSKGLCRACELERKKLKQGYMTEKVKVLKLNVLRLRKNLSKGGC